MKKMIVALKILATVYVILLMLVAANQRALLFPGAATQGSDDANVTLGTGEQLVSLSTPRLHIPVVVAFGSALDAKGLPVADWKRRCTVIFFYGNGNCLGNASDIMDGLRRLGVNVVMPDYPGYGLSGGRVSEQGCYDAADAAFDYATKTLGFRPAQVVAAGWSLGSGVAVHLASVHPVGGLAMCSSYTSVAEMGAHRYPIFPLVLVRLLLLDKFPSEQTIAKVRCPIFIAHGDDDPAIPYSMSVRLARAARSPVTFLRVRGVGHNDFFTDGGVVVYPALEGWIGAIASKAQE